MALLRKRDLMSTSVKSITLKECWLNTDWVPRSDQDHGGRGIKGEVYPFGIVGMANKGDCLQKGESVKFQLCVLGQNAQTMAYNITPLRRATVECVKDQVSGNTSGSNWIFLWVGNQTNPWKFFSQAGTINIHFFLIFTLSSFSMIWRAY